MKLKKYAVATFDNFSAELKLSIQEAPTKQDALIFHYAEIGISAGVESVDLYLDGGIDDYWAEVTLVEESQL